MFAWAKRKQRTRHAEIVTQVNAVQTFVLELLVTALSETCGEIVGPQLAHAVVDRLFARPLSLSGKERLLADRLSARLITENDYLRVASFASLQAMLEVETARHHFPAKLRITDTLEWVKKQGETPPENDLVDILARLKQASLNLYLKSLADWSQAASRDWESTISPIKKRDQLKPVSAQGETWQIT